MRWPDAHPACTDPALAAWAEGAEEVCPDGVVKTILRYLPGRRVSSVVDTARGPVVLKLFANPRARGNHRRLVALAASGAAAAVPRPIAVDSSGHVGLLEFVSGTTLAGVEPDRVPEACFGAGQQLARIHASGAVLDRTWTVDDELAQLSRTWGPASRASLATLAARCPRPSEDIVLPAHRDCHPAQAVVTRKGPVRWIDLDDAAMAPPGLDVGNFLAHLRREAVLRRLPVGEVDAGRAAFVAGYGELPADTANWELLSLARLAALAETRHRSTEETAMLLSASSELEA